MDSIIEFIFELFNSKDAKDTKYNDSVNILIFILIYFCFFIALLWVLSKLDLFG
ncbi:MAG: hypothetical protein ACI8WT_000367 [Clostridium sp.]|jgi:hypothetical protein